MQVFYKNNMIFMGSQNDCLWSFYSVNSFAIRSHLTVEKFEQLWNVSKIQVLHKTVKLLMQMIIQAVLQKKTKNALWNKIGAKSICSKYSTGRGSFKGFIRFKIIVINGVIHRQICRVIIATRIQTFIFLSNIFKWL